MKSIVLAAVLAFSVAANAQFSMDLPSLWWPNEFTGKTAEKQTDIQIISNSKELRSYMKRNDLGKMETIAKAGKGQYVVASATCELTVVVRNNTVLLIAGSVTCN